MNLKAYAAILIVAGLPLRASAQQGAPPSTGPKPTVAEVQKVTALIAADKMKLQSFCDLAKLDDQIAMAEQKKDTKKTEELDKKAEELANRIGPEYTSLMSRMEEIDPSSSDGQKLAAPFNELGKKCPK